VTGAGFKPIGPGVGVALTVTLMFPVREPSETVTKLEPTEVGERLMTPAAGAPEGAADTIPMGDAFAVIATVLLVSV
jgi:hypothetical protein